MNHSAQNENRGSFVSYIIYVLVIDCIAGDIAGIRPIQAI
jgi:hypothetical protein